MKGDFSRLILVSLLFLFDTFYTETFPVIRICSVWFSDARFIWSEPSSLFFLTFKILNDGIQVMQIKK